LASEREKKRGKLVGVQQSEILHVTTPRKLGVARKRETSPDDIYYHDCHQVLASVVGCDI